MAVHQASGLGICVIEVYFGGGNDAVVQTVVRDDLALPSHTVARLVTRLCTNYMPSVGQHGDCGLSAHVDLPQTLATLYVDIADADGAIALIDTALRSFASSV